MGSLLFFFGLLNLFAHLSPSRNPAVFFLILFGSRRGWQLFADTSQGFKLAWGLGVFAHGCHKFKVYGFSPDF